MIEAVKGREVYNLSELERESWMGRHIPDSVPKVKNKSVNKK